MSDQQLKGDLVTTIIGLEAELVALRAERQILQVQCQSLTDDLVCLQSGRAWRWLQRYRRLRICCGHYYHLWRTWLLSPAGEKTALLSSAEPPLPAPSTPTPVPTAGITVSLATVTRAAVLNRRVSVIIPTRNAGPEFAETLQQISRQRGIDRLELLIIDSGSTDGTLELARQVKAQLIEIPPTQFEHAGTRNQAAALAEGDILVFTVQDAAPVAEDWLYRLVEPLAAGRADAVSARAIPHANADLHARWSAWSFDRYLGFNGDSLRCGRDYPDLARLDPTTRRQLAHLDNVCLAINRPLFAKFQFCGRYAEDLDLGLRLLQTGHRLLYQVNNLIIHSHSRPASYFLRREYVNSLTLAELLGLDRGDRTLTEVLPTLRWGYQTFCLLMNARLAAALEPVVIPAALAALAEELQHLFTAPATSALTWLDLPLLEWIDPHQECGRPDPVLLAQLGQQLRWALHSLAEYLREQANSVTSAEVATTLHQFHAVAIGALLAQAGVAPTPELLRGV